MYTFNYLYFLFASRLISNVHQTYTLLFQLGTQRGFLRYYALYKCLDCYVKLGTQCFLPYRPGFRLMIPKPTSVWSLKGVNPVSALGVGGNDLWTKIIVAHTLKWPSGLVCLATCIILFFNFITNHENKLNYYDLSDGSSTNEKQISDRHLLCSVISVPTHKKYNLQKVLYVVSLFYLKALNTSSTCQRPVSHLVYPNMHKVTILWKFWLI